MALNCDTLSFCCLLRRFCSRHRVDSSVEAPVHAPYWYSRNSTTAVLHSNSDVLPWLLFTSNPGQQGPSSRSELKRRSVITLTAVSAQSRLWDGIDATSSLAIWRRITELFSDTGDVLGA
jgi:hypothetical protein